MKALLLGSVAAALITASAHAAIVPTFLGTMPEGSDTLFTFNLSIGAGESLSPGNFQGPECTMGMCGSGDRVALIDFNGFVPGSAASSISGFSIDAQNTLPSGFSLPAGVTDNNAVPDLIFTFTGPTLAATTFGRTFLDAFWATSTSSDTTNGTFVTQTPSGSSSGSIELPAAAADPDPGPSSDVPSGVPEPATWAMLLLGFFVIGTGARSVRRQRTA